MDQLAGHVEHGKRALVDGGHLRKCEPTEGDIRRGYNATHLGLE